MQDLAYSYRMWITLNKLLYARSGTSESSPLSYAPLPYRYAGVCKRVSEKSPSRRFGE
jgi:hypothetical protein